MPQQSLETFLAEPPTATTVRALTDALGALTPAAVTGLVSTLEAREARAHLDALGDAAADKALKKAARTAAHKLKSRGVASTFKRAPAVDLSVPLELDRLAVMSPVSLAGRFEGLVAPLPEAPGGMLDVGIGRGKQAETIRELTLVRVRALHKDALRDQGPEAPVLGGVDLAVRFIEGAHASVRDLGRSEPPALRNFLAWAERARALGADPAKAEARATVTPASLPPELLAQVVSRHPKAHRDLLPEELGALLDPKLGPEMHSNADIAEADFLAKTEAMCLEALDLWWTLPGVPAVAARWLELGADVLLAAPDVQGAAAFLAAADHVKAHTGPARTSPLLRAFLLDSVSLPSLWRHREAHMHGHAHH